MPVFSRIVSPIFRIGEILFGAVVGRAVGFYTEVIAGVSILLGLLWLFPSSFSFKTWPMDVILSLAWFASFAVQVNSLGTRNCGTAFQWTGFTNGDPCGRWRAAEAFSFLSACFWIVSALIGIWFTFRKRNEAVAGDGVGGRKWYRRHAV
ncbi:integral membrane protein [Trichophyton tonsurans CBS 112818]|uniref:Integral membrane protein n=1 Tax=Trichophyton tonsurans (strain CBS 112818) TaxID=647933 RepID=F2S421_TRIT1|nr:integral membrane protein [Trichophyton tonsurans CBS 112818]